MPYKDKENEWLPCDESGRIDDGYGNEPNATVAYLSSLEGSREVLVDGAREKVGEMDELSREMDEWSLSDEVGDMRGAHKNRFREAMRMDDCGSEKTIHYEEEGTQDGAKA